MGRGNRVPAQDGQIRQARRQDARHAPGSGQVPDAREDEVRLKLLLQQAGYSVFACENPEDALYIALDMGMNGRDLRNAIRQVRVGIFTLLASGYSQDVITHRGILDPDVEFLQKPVDKSELLKRVKRLMAERRSSDDEEGSVECCGDAPRTSTTSDSPRKPATPSGG